VLRCAAFFALVLAVTAQARPSPRVAFGPRPAWVTPVSPGPVKTPDVRGGVEYRLFDQQVRLGKVPVVFTHVVMRVTTQAGISEASNFAFDFDPGFERLTLHPITIIRNGRRIPSLRRRQVKVIEREQDLEQQLLDGQWTAVLVLPDIRVGDEVEYAVTREGQNPVFDGHPLGSYALGWDTGVGHVYLRLLSPKGLRLQVRDSTLKPRVRQAGTLTESVWELRDLPAAPDDDHVRIRDVPRPRVQVSDFERWEDVSRWATHLYALAKPTPAIRRQVAGWTALEPQERTRRALDFVQSQIRYFGFELGASSHRPHAPDEVLRHRFGDCKDKATLLLSMLRALDVQAEPALVNTRRQAAVRKDLPSPIAFDHVIVRAHPGGQTVWIDPTAQFEAGPLDRRVPLFGVALPLTARGEPLADIPAPRPRIPTVDVEESFDVSKGKAPVELVVTTRYREGEATSMRRRLAGEPLADVTRDNLGYYKRQFDKVRSLGTNELEDDQRANVITLTERYAVDDFWVKGERQLGGNQVLDYLPSPGSLDRHLPLAIRDPTHVRFVRNVTYARPPRITLGKGKVQTRAGDFAYDYRLKGSTLALEYRFASTADSIPAKEVPSYLSELEQVRKHTQFRLIEPGLKPSTAAGGVDRTALTVGTVILLLAAVLVLGVPFGIIVFLLARRHPSRPPIAAELLSADGTPLGEPPPTSNEPRLPEGAGFGRRAAARIVDTVLATLLALAAGAVSGAVMMVLAKWEIIPGDWSTRIGSGGPVRNVGFGLLALIFGGAATEAIAGTTFGKLAFGLRVVDVQARPVRTAAALIRNAAYLVDSFCFCLIGYLAMDASPTRQRVGDRWAKTMVVRAGPDLPQSARHSVGRVTFGVLAGCALRCGFALLPVWLLLL
jgi:uncharacterized RDD family membrane protein YckC